MKYILIFLMIIFPAASWSQPLPPENKRSPDIQQQVWRLTEVMFHDVVNPPAAARFYAYCMLAGYEALCQLDSSMPRWQLHFKNYPALQPVPHPQKINKELAVLYTILETGRNILPSGFLLEEKQARLAKEFLDKGFSSAVIDSSKAMAVNIAQRMAAYAKTDGYFQLSIKPRYKPGNRDENWKPTPPEYMGAVEPHWGKMRTWFLDSAQQFQPIPPVQFDKTEGSSFMKLAQEVYKTGQQLSKEQEQIANFWDCNPFAVQFQGHMSIGLKKISPGGHWMSITGIATRKAGMSFEETLLVHTLIALTLHDAFVSCWDEKYHSERIRPETVINRYIDPAWKPLLQTPPFPEYSSGHSVISTASAEVLTYLLGDHFSFADSTETYIGMPVRTFSSFRKAAAEARISRLYGGIHFRDAIENGEVQGRRIGEFVIEKAIKGFKL